MADEMALYAACEDADKQLLLNLLREHLTLSLDVHQSGFGGGKRLVVKIDFDGEPIATDFVPIG